VKLPGLEKSSFLRRPNRFTVECELRGKRVRAYLPNPGRLWELLLPGAPVHLRRDGPHRKLRYTAVAAERGGAPVPLETGRANGVFRDLLEEGRLPGLEGWRVRRAEVPVGRSRFDFLLEKGRREMLLEVKSCTLFRETLAMFPDAVTERGRRHLLGLAEEKRRRRGLEAGVAFIVNSGGARFFLPDYHTDIAFSRTLHSLRDELLVKPYGIEWGEGLEAEGVRELSVPWEVLEEETAGGGAYVLVLRLSRRRRLSVGSLGSVLFRRGCYLYVGSARRGLEARLARHRRRAKRRRWHVDYLREAADAVSALAVRSSGDLECALAEALGGISGEYAAGFGSSDCGCRSHLFFMPEDPIRDPRFIEVLLNFRMGRVEERLEGL
jgi:sugar fermentation stimulation protein A